MNQKFRNEKGQSIVIMAFAIIVLMGILALAIDGGRLYTLRRDAQNAADAAALQGARALCRDEDFESIALSVAERGGFSGPGIVEVNNPPLYSDAPTVNEDQVEVVITATIGGGLIAPIVYDGELDTRVHAVGDCLRGSLSGSGSALFAYCNGSGNEIDVNGSNIRIIGGVHSNGDVHITGGGEGDITITGTVSYNTGTNVPGTNTNLYPPDGNPVQTTPNEYPLDLAYADFVWAAEPYSSGADGWAYEAIMAAFPDGSRYHYYNGEINRGVLEAQGWITGDNLMDKGLYVSPVGFKFNAGGGDGGGDNLIGDDVTLISRGEIDFNGGQSMFRPFFAGLLFMTEGFIGGSPCDNTPVIKLTGSELNWGGIIFAPNGGISLNASGGGTFYGSLIAGRISLSGSDILIIYDPSYLPPDPDTIELGE